MKSINKLINYNAILLALSLPFSRAGISFFSITLILLWLIEGNFKEKYQMVLRSPIVIPFVLFITWSGLSLLWSTNLDFGLNYFRFYLYFFITIIFITSLETEYKKYTLYAFIFSMGISILIAYLNYFGVIDFLARSQSNPTVQMTHIDYSVLNAFFAITTTLLAINQKEKRFKYLFATLAILGTIILFIIQGRTGQVAFLAFIPLVVIYYQRKKLQAFLIGSTSLILFFLLAYNLSNSFQGRIDKGYDEIIISLQNNTYTGSLGTRLGLWKIGRDILSKSPFLGTGIGDIEADIKTYITVNEPEKMAHILKYQHLHNQFVQTTAQLGIIGLLLLLFIFYIILKSINDPFSKTLSFALFTTYFFASIGEPILHKQFSGVLFFMILGLIFNNKNKL